MERYTFAARHTEALGRLKTVLEGLGCTCTVEVSFMTHHMFELHTLVVAALRKEHPIKFTRAT